MKKLFRDAALWALLLLCLCFAVSCMSSAGNTCGSHDYDHDYGETLTVVAPTCTEAGSGKRVCTRCGHEKTGIVLPAAGHSYGKAEVTVPATCTAEGEERRICSVCGAENVTTILKAKHTLGASETVREATCIAEGETVRRCAHCEYTETGSLPKISHHFEETERRDATCEDPGLIVRTCPMCEEQKTEVIDRLGHLYASPAKYIYDYLDHANPVYCYHRYQHCQRCDRDIRTGVRSHSLVKDIDRSVNATCVARGLAAQKCERCPYLPAPEETPIDPTRHVRIAEKADEVETATCMRREYGECEGCHRVTWEMQVASHDYADLTLECRRGCGAVHAAGSSWFEYSYFNDGFAIKKLVNAEAFARYLEQTGGQVRLPEKGSRTVGGAEQTYEIRVIAGDLFASLDAEIAASVVSIYVPEGYAVVNAYAFRGLSSLATLYLPTSITDMKTRSLEGCVALTTLTMPHPFHTSMESLFGIPAVGGANPYVLTTLRLHRGTGKTVALSTEKLIGFSALTRVELATGSIGGVTYTLDGVAFTYSKTFYRNGKNDADGRIEFVLTDHFT